MIFLLQASVVFQVSTPNFFCALRKGKAVLGGLHLGVETVGSQSTR